VNRLFTFIFTFYFNRESIFAPLSSICGAFFATSTRYMNYNTINVSQVELSIYLYLKKSKIIQDLLDKLYITFIKSFLDHRFILEKIIEQFHKDKNMLQTAQIIPQQATSQANSPDENYTVQT